MHFSKSYIFFFVYLIHSIAADYDSSWAKKYPNCRGSLQSPIDLGKIRRIYKQSVSVSFNGYGVKPDSMKIENNGHTVQVTPSWNGKIPSVVKNGVSYEVQQLHFHWGPSNNEGSEHLFKDEKTPLELHIVHWNPKLGNFDARKGAGILAVGVLYGIVEDDDDYFDALFNILNYVFKIEKPHSGPFDIKPFDLESLLFNIDFKEYFTYTGSLTTPPCSQGVSWVIFSKKSRVTKKQMKLFRSIKLAGGEDHNNRRVQEINGRRLTVEKQNDNQSSARFRKGLGSFFTK